MTDADDYQAKRDALLAAENALIEQREQVAQLRRELPPRHGSGHPGVESAGFAARGPWRLDAES